MALSIAQQQAAARINRRVQNAAASAAASSAASSGGGGGSSAPAPVAAPTPTAPVTTGLPAGFVSEPSALLKEASIQASNGSLTTQDQLNTLKSSMASGAVTPTPTINRPVTSAYTQNSLSGANTAGGGLDTSSTDYRTQAEKDAQSYLDTYTPPRTEQQILDEKTARSRNLITSLEDLYKSKVSNQEEVNKQRSAEVNAQSVLSGLSGSSEAGARAIGASEKNAAATGAILAEKQVKLQEIYSNIQKEASTQFATEKTDARANAKDILANAEVKRTRAVENVKILAGAGFDLDAIKTNDPNTYASLVKSVGSEQQLNALMVVNRPKNDIVGTPVRVGDHYVQMYKNPITGVITAENIAIPGGLPANYTKFEKVGDKLVAIPDGWDGDLTKLKTIGGGTTSGSGTYTPGADPTVDSWANRIQNGTAKITEIPASQAALRNQVTVALNAMGNSPDGKPTTTELGKASLETAKGLLTKFTEGKGTSAVGKSGFLGSFGAALIPGTDRANFVTDFNSLKSQLSLEGVKYLKGQGQVSDSERALLAQAVTKLNLSQSEDEFKKTLQGIIDKLEGHASSGTSGTDPDAQRAELKSQGYTDEQIKAIENA